MNEKVKDLLLYMYGRYKDSHNTSMVLPNDSKLEIESLESNGFVEIHPSMPMGMMVSLTKSGIEKAKSL